MTRPFELSAQDLEGRLDEMVEATFADLQSQFITLPKGTGFIEFADFQAAYEVLKQHTSAFALFTDDTVWNALRQDALVFVVLRTILGFSPPEWADLVEVIEVPQGAARGFDTKVRKDRRFFARKNSGVGVTAERVRALVSVAIEYITKGAPPATVETLHRLNKVDTSSGIASLQHSANFHVPWCWPVFEFRWPVLSSDSGRIRPLPEGLPDDHEKIWGFIGAGELDDEFRVVTLDPMKIYKTWVVDDAGTTIGQAYKEFADRDQKRYIASLRKEPWLKDTVIVVSGDDVVDGFHRVVALALNKVTRVSALDLDEPTGNRKANAESLLAICGTTDWQRFALEYWMASTLVRLRHQTESTRTLRFLGL